MVLYELRRPRSEDGVSTALQNAGTVYYITTRRHDPEDINQIFSLFPYIKLRV